MRVGKKERQQLKLNKAVKLAAQARMARIETRGEPKLACHKITPSSGSAKRAATAWPNRWGFTRGIVKHSLVRKVG